MIPVERSEILVDLLARRRSAPPAAMLGPGPDAAQLATLLRLAARTPDHGKLAPWRFIVFEGEARDRAGAILAEIYKSDHPEAGAERLALEAKRLAHAPLVVAVVSRAAAHAKIPEWEQILSAGAVCMNLTIAARALGFSTAWLTEWPAYDARALARLGLLEHEKLAGFLHVGRVESPPDDRVRPDMAQIVTHF